MDYGTLASMDELWKNGKSKKNQKNSANDSLNPMLAVPKSMQLQPDWNRIPSKDVKMSEEEFEEAIAALAWADAERGVKMGDAGKGILAGEMDKGMLLIKYISVVSPDRKEAYEKFNGKGDVVYGKFNQELMTRGSDGVWKSEYLTKEENARLSKFYSIYMNAITEYEAEHGKLPYKPAAIVNGTAGNPYSQWAAYNPQSYPSMYNFLA